MKLGTSLIAFFCMLLCVSSAAHAVPVTYEFNYANFSFINDQRDPPTAVPAISESDKLSFSFNVDSSYSWSANTQYVLNYNYFGYYNSKYSGISIASDVSAFAYSDNVNSFSKSGSNGTIPISSFFMWFKTNSSGDGISNLLIETNTWTAQFQYYTKAALNETLNEQVGPVTVSQSDIFNLSSPEDFIQAFGGGPLTQISGSFTNGGGGGGGGTPVPEPGTMMLLGSGVLGMFGFRRKELLAYLKR